jgi:hypothetical protein
MKRMLIATLMALVFGLFSMPVLQAAPTNGAAIGSALKSTSPIQNVQWRWRRRRRRCAWVHWRRSRTRYRCWW